MDSEQNKIEIRMVIKEGIGKKIWEKKIKRKRKGNKEKGKEKN